MSESPPSSIPPILADDETTSPMEVPRCRLAIPLALFVVYVLGIGLLGARDQPVAGTVVSEKDATLLPTTVEGLLKLSAAELIFFGAIFLIALVFSRMRKADLLLGWENG